MLMAIRHKAQGWIAWVIVTLLIIPFALWGVNSYFTASIDNSVAKVNGVEINQQALQTAYQQQRERLQSMFGDNFNPAMFDEERMKAEVLQQLITEELLLQELRESGYHVSNTQVHNEIRNIGIFQTDGKFDSDLYRQQLRMRGFTPTSFEAQVSRSMIPGQFYAGLERSAFVTPNEAAQIRSLQYQERDGRYLTISADLNGSSVEVSTAEVSDFYQRNIQDYQVPEQVKVAYIDLKLEDYMANIEVKEEQLLEAYEERIGEFGSVEERRAAHILISAAEDADKQAESEALQLAETVLAKVKAGDSFADLAKQYSQDPGSAEQGGDLGFFGRGVMAGPFEDAVFSMTSGQVSELVRSEFGYHIIKLSEIRGGSTKSFAEVRLVLLESLKRRRAEDIFLDRVEQLANLAYENPESLVVASEQLQLPLIESGWLTRQGGEGVTGERMFIQAAFSPEVREGINSEVIELTPEHSLVLRQAEYRPAKPKPLAQVAEQIKNQLLRQKAQQAANKRGEALLAEVQAGADLAVVAQRESLELREAKGVKRGDTEPDRSIVQQLFKMPRPDGKPVITSTNLLQGGYAIIELKSITIPPAPSVTGGEEDPVIGTLQRLANRTETEAVIATLRDRAKITLTDQESN